jgi:hypothetical protein
LKEHHFMIRKHVVINYTILTLAAFWKSIFFTNIRHIFLHLCSEGKECTLREVDPDFEERLQANESGYRRSTFRRRRGIHKSAHTEEGIQSPQQCVLDEDNQSERHTHMFHRHRSSATKWTSAMAKTVYSEEVDKTEVQCSILMCHYWNTICAGTLTTVGSAWNRSYFTLER